MVSQTISYRSMRMWSGVSRDDRAFLGLIARDPRARGTPRNLESSRERCVHAEVVQAHTVSAQHG